MGLTQTPLPCNLEGHDSPTRTRDVSDKIKELLGYQYKAFKYRVATLIFLVVVYGYIIYYNVTHK